MVDLCEREMLITRDSAEVMPWQIGKDMERDLILQSERAFVSVMKGGGEMEKHDRAFPVPELRAGP